MLDADDIRIHAQRLWDNGSLLRAWLGVESLFPWTLPLAPPGGAELPMQFPLVAQHTPAIEAGCKCAGGEGYRIEYQEVERPGPGPRRIPHQVVFDTPLDLIGYLGKSRELGDFVRLARDIRRRHPGLKHWIEARPLAVLEHRTEWPQLLAVLDRLIHSRPGISLRELTLPGTEPGFAERHEALLQELFDTVGSAPADSPLRTEPATVDQSGDAIERGTDRPGKTDAR